MRGTGSPLLPAYPRWLPATRTALVGELPRVHSLAEKPQVRRREEAFLTSFHR